MSHDSTHPSIVTIGVKPAPGRSFPLGFNRLDVAYDGAALAAGTLAVIQGGPKSGRTTKLLEAAATAASICAFHDRGVVLVAVATDTAASVVERLRRALLSEETLLRHVRIAYVGNSSELALFVAQVVESGQRPAALFVDDFGALGHVDGKRHEIQLRNTTILQQLTAGNVAGAVKTGTGLPFGALQLSGSSAHAAPIAVAVTLRTSREGGRVSHPCVQDASVVVGVDGTVVKSRRTLTPVG